MIMIPGVIIFLSITCIYLLIQQARSMIEIRSLCRQLEEIERGSHMELGILSRQRHMAQLCRKLNKIQNMQHQKLLQHEKAERHLMQNITSLAHDIRTPLTGASGYVQLAQECRDDEKKERYLKEAGSRMKELEDMLEELFLYTKLTCEEFQPNLCEIQVLPFLSECLVGMYRQFEERGIAPRAEFESEGFRVLADEECLKRIFHNLVQNALQHGSGGITVRQKGRELFFENAVSGTGRPDLDKIFEQFYKSDSARRKGSSGLGLFIVKELAEKMGWSVAAQLEGETLRIILKVP